MSRYGSFVCLGLAKFLEVLWNYGVSSIDALADLEHGDCIELGLTPLQFRNIQKLAKEGGSGGGVGEGSQEVLGLALASKGMCSCFDSFGFGSFGDH